MAWFGRRETAKDCPHPWRPPCRRRWSAAPRPGSLAVACSSPDAGLSERRTRQQGFKSQPILHCPVQGTVEHGVDAPYDRTAETGAFLLLLFHSRPCSGRTSGAGPSCNPSCVLPSIATCQEPRCARLPACIEPAGSDQQHTILQLAQNSQSETGKLSNDSHVLLTALLLADCVLLFSAAQRLRGPSVISGAGISSKGGENKVLRCTIRWPRFFPRGLVFFL